MPFFREEPTDEGEAEHTVQRPDCRLVKRSGSAINGFETAEQWGRGETGDEMSFPFVRHAAVIIRRVIVPEESAGCSKRPFSKAAASEEARAYASVRGASERGENAAGGLFQHPARQLQLG